MGELKRMILEGEIKDDDRLYIKFKYFQDDKVMSDFNMDYETQGRLLKDVLGTLESEFSSCDSFKDLKKHVINKQI